ncbi:MAG: mannitol dehydrogenase family protein [Lachnospiraceae bacterium]|nr:mannitol dehydrogenase family protein [Lachnospiraceae bacterium]
MILSKEGLKNKAEWEKKGYRVYKYDRDAMIEETRRNPKWIHFGAGNIFRAFQADLMENLLDEGIEKSGLIAAEGFDYEIIDKMYRPHDNLGVAVTLCADGQIRKAVIGSIAQSLTVDPDNSDDYNRLKEIFAAPSLQMVSFTITEKGYSLKDNSGNTPAPIAEDFKNGPYKARSYMGKVSALLFHRFENGAKPVAMVSMDNCSHNGDKLKAAVTAFARAWVDNGVAPKEFLDYTEDEGKVSFPWSMIDKITPRPDKSVEDILIGDGIEALEPVITSKNTYVAPFVNAEESQYLVIEDKFPAGRPALDRAGVIFTDKETVDKVEKMKVCTCLNPLHTALAVFGCLMGYTLVSKEMQNPLLKHLVEIIGYEEGLPVVVDPGVLKPRDFIDQVVNVRIPNPFMPDAPQRIATDTSQKLGIRFGETIKAYKARPDLDPADLRFIPLVFAGWLRYLMGIDDKGEKFELSSDPMLDVLVPRMAGVKLGDKEIHETVKPILSDAGIFGSDLYSVGLGERVEGYFLEMLEGPGAIEKTLKKYIG